MREINWDDNARGAVREFYQWANARFKSGCSVDADVFLKEFTESQQPKTVADAVEVYPKWQEPHFMPTRENLEKIAKDAQGDFVEVEEGEKWTHTYFSIRCRIMDLDPDEFGTVVIIKNGGDYALAHPSKLKPIKPAISQEQAKAVMEFATEHGLISEGQIWTSKEREIIEGPAND